MLNENMKKILIIEDTESIRQEIYQLLKLEGYSVFEAESGETGIETAKKELPDLILCDILMPKMDGFEVLTLLRNNPSTESIRFIFLTALNSQEFINKLSELEFTGYIRKPYKAEELLEMIDKHFRAN